MSNQDHDAPAPSSDDQPDFPVVGIGASAGGIDALQHFFPAVPTDCGMAFVVVQHLDPHHQSLLPAILARASRLPVTRIENESRIEPNHVYVIPPDAGLTLNDGLLHLTRPREPHGQRNPIDGFLLSLSQACGEKAACVILSGTGSDGTLGLRAVKENGGLTLAQAGAEYDGMMRSALSTGLVDFVLPAEEMPAKLVDYFRSLLGADGRKGSDGVRQEAAHHLDQICTLLRTRTGHDFKDYKDKTVVRRVQRRMQVLQIEDVPTFIEHLRKEPREVDLLFQDLLIGVTNFFRDAEAFEALETQVIPNLLKDKGPDDTIRVWVPGCATGEEAYSVAILLRDHMPKAPSAPKLQIFASDIDEHALQVARVGRYPASIAKDVPQKRLERYFLREDGTYRIASDLREICLFSVHNLLRDAPFSKLDLISCRNLLIYLNPDLQNRVIPLFHYALRKDGYLFLGTSENVTRHSRLFSTIDKTHRIFRRRPLADRRIPEFPLTAPDPARQRLPYPGRPAGTADITLQSLAERQLLDRYSPAYAIVNAEGEVLHSSGRTGKYLELPAGTPDNNIFSMARSGLRLDLRAAIHKASANSSPAVQNNVSIGTNGGRQTLDLIVHPLPHGGAQDPLYMVIFQDLGPVKPASELPSSDSREDVESASLRQLEMELRATKERLQTTTEELESSNEELKSSNEELSSMNEELQSSNEELETSREELQSINEELQTVNSELNARVEELSRANSDMANLLESTQIATVFLDRNLAVKSFTPAAKDVFRLVESDTGRPITHVRALFDTDTVEQDAERVLRTLGTIERQVASTETGARYIMRVLPYRTVDNVISGVVITFADITRITAAEARIDALTHDLRNRVESLETLLDLVPVGIFITEDRDGAQVQVNRYGTRLLGEEDDRKGPRQVAVQTRLFHNDHEVGADEHPLRRAMEAGEAVPSFDGRLLRPDGSAVDVMISATPLFDAEGHVRGAIAALMDISDRRQAEAHQRLLLHELQHRVKNILATVASLATRTVRTSASVDEFSQAFLPRLTAMGRMHDLLSQQNWRGADIRMLLDAALEPYATSDARRIVLEGPPVALKPNTAATLGMIFHELATNATKYGALSAPAGRLKVSWKAERAPDGDVLSLSWTEQDGPRVSAEKEGFGSNFVRRSMEYELNGSAALEFRPDGLRCEITFPLGLNAAGRRALERDGNTEP